MNLLFYSSPYKYYQENLIPLADYAEEKGHKVYRKFSLKEEKDIRRIIPDNSDSSIYDLISKKQIDAAVLVQPWWYADKEVAGACNKYKIPFYIVDHAPPMTAYTEASGKKSHLYRGNIFGAKAFFAYGDATKKIMKQRGCKGNIVIVGSPRIEKMLDNYKTFSEQKDFKAFVLFDTSNRMEDSSLLKEVNKFRNELSDEWKFFIKKHSRSPSIYDQINGIGSIDGSEEQIFYFADKVGFTFPSSAMILPALVEKDMIVFYDKHYCKEAISYYNKYSESITNYKGKKIASYDAFIRDNYKTNKSPKAEILRYIKENS